MLNIGLFLSAPLPYDEAVYDWQRGLSETTVRELASEYLRGMVDECTTDAYAEYQRRFGDELTASGKPKKTAKKTQPKPQGQSIKRPSKSA